jgi:hypothetical protein
MMMISMRHSIRSVRRAEVKELETASGPAPPAAQGAGNGRQDPPGEPPPPAETAGGSVRTAAERRSPAAAPALRRGPAAPRAWTSRRALVAPACALASAWLVTVSRS